MLRHLLHRSLCNRHAVVREWLSPWLLRYRLDLGRGRLGVHFQARGHGNRPRRIGCRTVVPPATSSLCRLWGVRSFLASLSFGVGLFDESLPLSFALILLSSVIVLDLHNHISF